VNQEYLQLIQNNGIAREIDDEYQFSLTNARNCPLSNGGLIGIQLGQKCI
jgi:hypothetical protein